MGEIVVNQYAAIDCYDKEGNSLVRTQPTFRLGGPYTFSDTQNKFTVLGCDTLAYINGSTENKFSPQIPSIVAGFTTGCASYCYRSMFVTNGSCNGFGCCQTSIPKGLKNFSVNIYSYHNHSYVINFNPCSYAFLTDQKFTFRGLSDLGDYYRVNNRSIPLVLDWAIGNQTCEEANKTSDYACVSQNSTCYNSTNGPGYRCNCSAGYEGNPYLHGGCQDIDECKDKAAYPCKGLCTNTQGNYSCECPKGKHSVDPKLYKCEKPFPVSHVTLGKSPFPYQILDLLHVIFPLLISIIHHCEKKKNTIVEHRHFS
ncbi:Wall-associated receptor kinase 2 [Acorus gramineus]|uniref:Wall-associated receptor kinase 2 n=1 Tax=Acorus gramineus TaxID=55184 RepID=A0AAV9B7C2_ACOGR|nr:Wall-associated receptor kinase 2 [Acorus gramineus]